VITSVWIVPLLLISGFQRVELPVDRLWLMTVLSLNEQLFVLAFMNANCVCETYILS
jgi:hypothetical protein